jgi:ketosteroid isomerase-like protein
MRKFFGVMVLAWFCIVPQVVRAAEAPDQDSGEVETLKRLGQQMGDAMIAGDIDTLDRMFADDWASRGASGKKVTKESMLQAFKSGTDKLESFVLGPMDVQVLGNVASVKGSVTEKRHRDGKEVGGEFLYMDLLEKRAGRWVVIRSAGMRVK